MLGELVHKHRALINAAAAAPTVLQVSLKGPETVAIEMHQRDSAPLCSPKVWERMRVQREKVGQRRSEDDSEVELLADVLSLNTSWP